MGLDIPLRSFPNGQPVRDAAQIKLLARLRAILPRTVRLRFEVALGIRGDLRAWDAAMETPTWWRPVEAETRIRDTQALQRRIRLKLRDGGVGDVVLLVAGTRHNRHVLRDQADALADLFPVRSSVILAALREGREPPGSGILLL